MENKYDVFSQESAERENNEPIQNELNEQSKPIVNWDSRLVMSSFNNDRDMRQQKQHKSPNVTWLGVIACMLIMMLVGGAVGGLCVHRAMQGKQAQITMPATVPSNGINYTDESANTELSDAAALAENCKKAIVSIYVTVTSPGGMFGGETTSQGSGSGVIMTADGYIATCNHVISGANAIKVALQDGTTYEAKLVGYDSRTDLAVIKIEANGLHAATIGSSDKYAVGDAVYAVGNPLGELLSSVTKGIISGIDRSVEIDGQTMTLMQIDAAVNPGNSGGGLFSATTGELIGIVNAKSYGVEIDGLGFAIPTETARSIVTDIMDLGHVTGRPYLGISMQTVYVSDNNNTSIFGNLFGNTKTAVLVVSVADNSPAVSSGISTGDYIIKVGDTDISDTDAFKNELNKYNAGDTVTLTIQRNNQTSEVKVKLGESSSCN